MLVSLMSHGGYGTLRIPVVLSDSAGLGVRWRCQSDKASLDSHEPESAEIPGQS